MKLISILLLSLTVGSHTWLSPSPTATTLSQESLNPQSLIGTWQVDLRPTPDAAPYYTELVINSVSDNTFEGTFYGSRIQAGHINMKWGKICLAFVTQDGSGPYNTYAELSEEGLTGGTHSLGRGFLSPWSATRKDQ